MDTDITTADTDVIKEKKPNILTLVSKDDPILKTITEDFDFSNPPINPKELATDLVSTMLQYRGLGLASPQCGLPYRVFVMNSAPEFLACFNPRIVDKSTEEIYLDEGCLSFPYLVMKIKRPKIIKVRFTDITGNTYTEKYIGMTARIFLHEIDHLDGIIFTSRANSYHKDMADKKRKIFLRKNKGLQKEAYPSDIRERFKFKIPSIVPFNEFAKSKTNDMPETFNYSVDKYLKML